MQANEAVDRLTDDAAAILVGLASHLEEHYGLQAELYEDSTPSPQLLVTQAGMDTTLLYVAVHPGLRKPAVYGFCDLYLGFAHDAPKVAARLAWLLGLPALLNYHGRST